MICTHSLARLGDANQHKDSQCRVTMSMKLIFILLTAYARTLVVLSAFHKVNRQPHADTHAEEQGLAQPGSEEGPEEEKQQVACAAGPFPFVI